MSIKNGTLRMFSPIYIDATTKPAIFENSQHPTIFLFLSTGQDDVEAFNGLVKTYPNPLSLYVLCENVSRMTEIVAEAMALESIQSERAEIKSDPVAQRELKDRLQTVRHIEAELLNQYLDNPELNQWFWQGEPMALPTRRELQHQLSDVLESVYNQAPLVKNELINRNKVSGRRLG
jgi:hypothetical protein